MSLCPSGIERTFYSTGELDIPPPSTDRRDPWTLARWALLSRLLSRCYQKVRIWGPRPAPVAPDLNSKIASSGGRTRTGNLAVNSRLLHH